jgi:hypothetical protein
LRRAISNPDLELAHPTIFCNFGEYGMNYQSDRSVDSGMPEFAPVDELLAHLDLLAWRREVEIFGCEDDLPSDEWALVFESNLPHKEMMAELTILRAGKREKAADFEGWMTPAGRIHAHALGVWIDPEANAG